MWSRPCGSPTTSRRGSPRSLSSPRRRAPADALQRVLRHLVGRGLFEEPSTGRFAFNDPARRLLDGAASRPRPRWLRRTHGPRLGHGLLAAPSGVPAYHTASAAPSGTTCTLTPRSPRARRSDGVRGAWRPRPRHAGHRRLDKNAHHVVRHRAAGRRTGPVQPARRPDRQPAVAAGCFSWSSPR